MPHFLRNVLSVSREEVSDFPDPVLLLVFYQNIVLESLLCDPHSILPSRVQQILALCHRSDKQATEQTEGQGYKCNLRGGLHAAPRLHFGERRRLPRFSGIVFRSQLPDLDFPSL